MNKTCGGEYEIVREGQRVAGSTSVTTQNATLTSASAVDWSAKTQVTDSVARQSGSATATGIVGLASAAFTSTSVTTLNVIEFRCVQVRREPTIPVVDESSSRAEKLRAEIRTRQAAKAIAARDALDPHGFRDLKWGTSTADVQQAFPQAKRDERTGLLEFLEPVAGVPASTLFGVAKDKLEFVIIRLDERRSFDSALKLLTEKYGEPDTHSSEAVEWRFPSTRIRLTPDVRGSAVRYEDANIERRNEF